MPFRRPVPQSLLLIDDSHSYCALVERAFRQVQPGTTFFTLPDGNRAIEHLRRCGLTYPTPDLVLLDRTMPGGPDGYEVLRVIRACAHLATLPILMLSGSDDDDHMAQAYDAGASGYIIKPPVQSEYPQLAREVLAWWAEKNRAQLGPNQAGTSLNLAGPQVISPPMSVPTHVGAFFATGAEEQSLFARVVGFIEWARDTAQASLDPFQVAFSQACRKHHITPVQAMQKGGSHRMISNRRGVLVDLIQEGWPDETLLQVVHVSATELKRLKAEARTKVGLKLGQGSN